MKFYFSNSKSKEAIDAKDFFISKYGQNKPEDADIIVPIGGDGFLLKSLHDFHQLSKPFFGINYGSVGFLMNAKNDDDLEVLVNQSKETVLYPLQMNAVDSNNKSFTSIAFNEVSLMRQTHQASKIKIKINEIERIKELVCDGVLVATAAGSTAYNLSAHGSIIPLNSNLLALTPISAFRPRRWRGALLQYNTNINFEIIDNINRPVSATADHSEYRDIIKVDIISSNKNSCKILLDSKHSMEERILKEQFYS
ncbi:NAD kinase [Alphaproteobacteria bacterium]|nr:NAD kinase [Alphaproteobacteria bacterium]